MGLFDRFRAPAGSSDNLVDTTRQNAMELILQGNALEDEGLPDQALQRYEAAIQLMPSLARAHLNRGNILLDKGDTESAMAAYTTALVHDPAYAAAHFNAGNALLRSGRQEAALAAYDMAIALKPEFVEAEIARSNVLNDLGQLEVAAAGYRRVLESEPGYAEVHHNLGATLNRLGRLNEAVLCYQRARELKPDLVEAHSSLGSILQDLGRLEEAAVSYRRALALRPDFLEVHGNLGTVLKDLGQLDDAAASYRRVLRIRPDSAEAYSNLGIVLNGLGRFDEAMANYRRALELNPGMAAAHHNIGSAWKDMGQFDQAEASFREALQVNPDYAEAASNLLFLQNFRPNQSAGASLSDARRYGEIVALRARCCSAWSNSPDPGRCLRVGFLSGDFRDHPVGNFIESVLAALAANTSGRMELLAYSSHFFHDAVTARINTHCHGWRSVVGLSDERLTQRIRDDGVDILIDLSGHTAHNRLPVFAWKPAPIQATWLGYPATTGVREIDYLIADEWTLPQSEEVNFTERVWRLPRSYLCFTPPSHDVEVGPLPASGNGYVTFGCFNNLIKMNDAVVALWSRILTAVPQSRLFLKSRQLHESSQRLRVIERFSRHGIAGRRLILEAPVPRAEYLAPYQRLDIALDPFPYPGITTSVESLWMGVPVLTLAGKSFLSRQGVGLLMNTGLPEWIAHDADDYVGRATSHARDLLQLGSLRSGLRQRIRTSPIFDAPGFADNFEAALRTMWTVWCDRQYPPPK